MHNSSPVNVHQHYSTAHTCIKQHFFCIQITFPGKEQYPVGTPEWLELFWVDGFHPSSLGHQKIFEAALATVEPVPEPATLLLFGIGIIGFIGLKLRQNML